MQNRRSLLIEAGAIMDGTGVYARPGFLALDADKKVVYAGDKAGVPQDFLGEGVQHVYKSDGLLVPGFVNAHAHLDLTVIGPKPYQKNFMNWLMEVLRDRPQKKLAWQKSFNQGVRASLKAGVVAVGDIAPSARALTGLQGFQKTKMQGTVFAEEFGMDEKRSAGAPTRIGAQRQQGNEENQNLSLRANAGEGTRAPLLGIQPHAPYTAGPALYQAAVESGLPLSTHLSETPEESEFISKATGMYRELLEKIGAWQPAYAALYNQNISPVQWLDPYLSKAHWLVAHVNYASDADLEILARTQTSVAYCPVASDYFQHKNHRYRDMLARGINVCLGTDSILCQKADEAQPLGILPQMRHLFLRDDTAPELLLKMATVNGAKALGLEKNFSTFQVGAHVDPVALSFNPDSSAHPLEQALLRKDVARPLFQTA